MSLRFLLLASTIAIVSCGSSTTNPPAGPSLTRKSSPTAVVLFEGERGTTSFDLTSSSSLTSHIDPVEGLELEVQDSSTTPEGGVGNSDARHVGVTVRAGFGAPGTKSAEVVTTSPSGEEIRTPIEVQIKSLQWKPTTTWSTDGPEAREHGALIVDEKNQRVILVGGSGYAPYGTPLADVWSWSLADRKWSKPTVEGDLPAAGGSRRVARLDDSNVYLFGGYGDGSAVDDFLYRVDLASSTIKFKKLTHTGGAPARSLHAFVYDRKGDRFVVFGGAGSKPMNDTWTMKIAADTVTWTKLDVVGPSARYGFFYGFDEDARRLVVFSGAQSFSTVKPAQDTWALDLAADPPVWSTIAVGDANAPPGRRNGCFVFDPEKRSLFVFGGTADAKVTEAGFFVLDARPGKESWTKLERAGEPPLRSSGIGYYDAKTKDVVCGFGNTTGAVYTDFTAFGRM